MEPFCHKCGRGARRVIEIYVPCPYCTVDVRVHLCPECARKLAEGILNLLEGGEGA